MKKIQISTGGVSIKRVINIEKSQYILLLSFL